MNFHPKLLFKQPNKIQIKFLKYAKACTYSQAEANANPFLRKHFKYRPQRSSKKKIFQGKSVMYFFLQVWFISKQPFGG